MDRLIVSIVALIALAMPALAGPEWTPEEWTEGSTLRFQTTDVDRNEHWSTVWYVVIQGDIYARLGTAAAELVENNVKRPYVRVKIAGKEFQDVRADPAPGMAEWVADEMADKYPTDFLFRFLPHPMTVRLRAASFASF